MSRLLLDVLTELCVDEEFAQRFRVGGFSSEILVKYLTDRGVEEMQAEFLTMAYEIGGIHSSEAVGRALDKIQRALKP